MAPAQHRTSVVAVLGALFLALLLAALDQTIVSTALPTIVGELGGLTHLSWVVTSYLLASTVVPALYGKLGAVRVGAEHGAAHSVPRSAGSRRRRAHRHHHRGDWRSHSTARARPLSG